MEKRNWRIYLTLPGHFLNIHLGHGAADHSFKIMLSDPEGQTTPPPPCTFSILQRWKTSRGQLIQDPSDIPPDLVPPQNAREAGDVSMHHRDTVRSPPPQTPRQRAKVNSISTWANEAWQAIDLSLSKTSILAHSGAGAQVTRGLDFFKPISGGIYHFGLLIRGGSSGGQLETLPPSNDEL